MAEIKDNPIINSIAQAGQAQAASQQTALSVHQMMDQEDMANSAAVVARSAMGGAEQTMSSEQNAWKAATDAKVAETRTVMGADPTLQGSLSNTWLQRMNDAAEKQYQSLNVIQEKQSKTLLNDPLGFISAQFTLPADIATHNYYNGQRDIAEKQLNEITSASDANVIAINRAQQHTSSEYAMAESTKAAQGAELDNARLISENAGKQIVGLNDLNSLTQQQLNTAFQVHAAANSDAQLAETKKLHQDNLALRQERADKKADDDAGLDSDRQAYNMAMKRMGKPEIVDNRLWRNIYTHNYGRDQNFMNELGQGQTLAAAGGVTNGVAMSGSAGETAQLYASGSTTNLKTDPVGAFLYNQLASVKSTAGAPKDHLALSEAVTTAAVKAAKDMKGQIRDDSANIYAAPPPAIVLGTTVALSDPFLSTVIKPIADLDPKKSLPDGTIFGQAFEFAGRQQGNTNMAADGIANYYKVAVLKNNLLNQYTEKGLPPQTNYPVVIDNAVVDATDVTAVKRAILLHNTRAAISGDASFFSGMGQPGQ